MTGAIEKLTFKDNQVRTIRHDGDILWCGVDCCNILEISNARKAMARLETDERLTVTISDGQRPTRANFVTEAGLYKLIMLSRKPVAKEFQRWVCHEVLPSIRRTGCYSVGGAESCPPALQAMNGVILKKAAAWLMNRREKLWSLMKMFGVKGASELPDAPMAAEDFMEIVEWCVKRLDVKARIPEDNTRNLPNWAIEMAVREISKGE